jgi:spore coat protein U-like protein
VLLVIPITVAMATLADARQGGGDSSASMQVTANVIRKCTIRAEPMNFGNYDPVQANATAPLDGQSVITVACTKGTTVNMAMDNGANAQGQNRRMTGGTANFLQYEVYKDASRTEVWGATGNAVYDGGVAPSRDPRQFVAYGRVAGGQDVAEGNFQDTVLVTVDF